MTCRRILNALALSLGASQAFASPMSYTALDLGNVVGYSLNNHGQVVGALTSHIYSNAFMTGSNGTGLRGLSPLGLDLATARAINASGQVVGYSPLIPPNTNFGANHAFITSPDGSVITDLGTLGTSAFYSYGLDINATGQVTGWSDSYGPAHAFLTGPNGADIADLGTLGGFRSWGGAANDVGQVAGDSQILDFPISVHAYITGPGGAGVTDLGTLGGNHSYGYDIGQVVGESNPLGSAALLTSRDPTGSE